MDWIIGLGLLLTGGVLGFFIARHLYMMASKNAHSSRHTEKTIKEIMAQQAEHHIASSRHTLEQMQRHCQTLEQQLQSYQSLLQAEQETEGTDRITYYGEQASAYLRNKTTDNARAKSSADVQPKDFAGESSGLFIGKNEQDIAENK